MPCNVCRWLMGSYHRHATSWHWTHATVYFAKSKLYHFYFSTLAKLSELTESESTIPYFRYEKHEGKQFSTFDADYVVFHSPYNKVPETHILYDFKISVAKCTWQVASQWWSCKGNLIFVALGKVFFIICFLIISFCFVQLVQKSFARLYYNDFLRNCRFVICYISIFACIKQFTWQNWQLAQLKDFPPISSSTVDEESREKLAPYAGLSSEESYQSRDLEKVYKRLDY